MQTRAAAGQGRLNWGAHFVNGAQIIMNFFPRQATMPMAANSLKFGLSARQCNFYAAGQQF